MIPYTYLNLLNYLSVKQNTYYSGLFGGNIN